MTTTMKRGFLSWIPKPNKPEIAVRLAVIVLWMSSVVFGQCQIAGLAELSIGEMHF